MCCNEGTHLLEWKRICVVSKSIMHDEGTTSPLSWLLLLPWAQQFLTAPVQNHNKIQNYSSSLHNRNLACANNKQTDMKENSTDLLFTSTSEA